MSNFSRRNFLKLSAFTSAFFGLNSITPGKSTNEINDIIEELATTPAAKGKSVIGLKVAPIKQVRVAMIGLGNRGSGIIELVNALAPDKATLVAICDIQKKKVDEAVAIINKTTSGQKPDLYFGKKDSWQEMVKRDDIDLVIICTPWEDHTPMSVFSMKNGKHVACEVPIALTLEEAWLLVDTAEQTQKNCMMMENVCYGDEELWVLNMVKNGVFGELTYGEAAYIHDLRELNFSETYYYDFWRIKHHESTDGNLYPTHGLGPVAQYMDINRGDKFDHLVSMSTLQAGMTEYAKTVDPKNPYYKKTKFRHGDMNYSMIKTNKGRVIIVEHDVVTPRPYNRINMLAGTKAFHVGYPSRLSIEPNGHSYLKQPEYKEYRDKYNHPIWARLKNEIEKYGGHGGMDFVMIYRLIDCLNQGVPLDIDIYDGAAWSAVTPLSTKSLELGNNSVKFPDFTRGKWKETRDLGILTL